MVDSFPGLGSSKMKPGYNIFNRIVQSKGLISSKPGKERGQEGHFVSEVDFLIFSVYQGFFFFFTQMNFRGYNQHEVQSIIYGRWLWLPFWGGGWQV